MTATSSSAETATTTITSSTDSTITSLATLDTTSSGELNGNGTSLTAATTNALPSAVTNIGVPSANGTSQVIADTTVAAVESTATESSVAANNGNNINLSGVNNDETNSPATTSNGWTVANKSSAPPICGKRAAGKSSRMSRRKRPHLNANPLRPAESTALLMVGLVTGGRGEATVQVEDEEDFSDEEQLETIEETPTAAMSAVDEKEKAVVYKTGSAAADTASSVVENDGVHIEYCEKNGNNIADEEDSKRTLETVNKAQIS